MVKFYPGSFVDFAQKYKRVTSASALFYYATETGQFGFRLECLELMLEFTNGVKFGKDPEGLLFFNDAKNFDDNMKSGYKVFLSEDMTTIEVDFYPTADDNKGDPFAVFYAKDQDANEYWNLANGIGTWNTLQTTAAASRIHKVDTFPTVTVTAPSIGKMVKFDVVNPSNKPIKGNGILYFPDLNNLDGANCVVNYTPDRIIYSDPSDNSKLVAVFFPSLDTQMPSGFTDEATWPVPTFPIATWAPFP